MNSFSAQMPELGFFTRFWEYLYAAGVYWWAALAVLLAIERLAERLFPNWWKANIDPWFTPALRKRVLILFAAVAFLYGNFRAFDEQAAAVRAAATQIAKTEGERDSAKALAGEKQKEIDRLTLQIDQLKNEFSRPENPSRNPDGLYQLGDLVGTVGGAKVDRGNSIVTFQVVRSSGNLNAVKEVEYRDFVLKCNGLPTASPLNVIVGTYMGMSVGVECTILRHR